jgi:hypothetical protein
MVLVMLLLMLLLISHGCSLNSGTGPACWSLTPVTRASNDHADEADGLELDLIFFFGFDSTQMMMGMTMMIEISLKSVYG